MAVRVVAGDAVAQPEDVASRRDSRGKSSSRSARAQPGLRACTGLSRHSSVVSSVPAAVHVDAAAFQHHAAAADASGSHDGHFSFGRERSVAASSFCQSSYLAQALKCQLVMRDSLHRLRVAIS